MRTSTRLPLLLLILALSALPLGCGSDAQSKDRDEDDAEEAAPAVPVEAATVEAGTIAAFFTGTASLEAEEEALVVAKTGGTVMQIFAEEGQYVQAGQPLAKLDDDRYVLELARAEAALAQQQRAYERIEELHTKNLISAEEYERVKSEYETQQAQRDLAELEVTNTTVRAPFGGVVAERLIKVGNMVGTHEPTFRLTDFDPLLAVLHVPERELDKLRTGQRAELRLDALPGEVYEGTIERISPVVDPTTGTFKVTVEVRDRSGALKPGMFGRVRIVYDTHEGVLLVPKESVLAEDAAASLYVIRDSIARRMPVQTGYEDDVHIEITEGLAAGDLVIVTGQNSLRDSTRVEVID